MYTYIYIYLSLILSPCISRLDHPASLRFQELRRLVGFRLLILLLGGIGIAGAVHVLPWAPPSEAVNVYGKLMVSRY